MEHLEKSWNFKIVISRPGKVMGKTEIIKVLEKSWKFVIITCSFMRSLKIIKMFFTERRSKYKPAIALNTQNVLNCSCLYRDFSLVMEIWFKVMEIHWSKWVRTLNRVNQLMATRRYCCNKTFVSKKPYKYLFNTSVRAFRCKQKKFGLINAVLSFSSSLRRTARMLNEVCPSR